MTLTGDRNKRGRKELKWGQEERPEVGAIAGGSPAGKSPAWSGAARSKDDFILSSRTDKGQLNHTGFLKK